MIPLSVVVFQSMTISTGFRWVAEGPHSPDQVPISGWPSWATTPVIVAIARHAHTHTKQKTFVRTLTSTLRNNPAAAIELLVVGPNHQYGRQIAILADELELLRSRRPSEEHPGRPRCGVGFGIVDGDFIAQRGEIGARDAFGEVK